VELIRTVRSHDNLGVPLLLLANKQDLPGAKEPHEIETLMQLRETLHNTLYHVQPACAITGKAMYTHL
jgi:ADP-ribosylation factor-like protein 4